MILDALTRAEHERQIEKQPKLKFVNPVKQQQKTSRNIWLWVAAALGINALVLAIILQVNSNDVATNVIANNDINDASLMQAQTQMNQPTPFNSDSNNFESAVPSQEDQVPVIESSLQEEFQMPANSPQVVENSSNPSLHDAQPLALESIDSSSIEPLDRPLIYEAKQAKNSKAQQKKTVAAIGNEPNSIGKKKGAVSFSTTPLSSDEYAPIVTQAPKLLIDQGQESINPPASTVPSLKDLPQSSRNVLSQYEVNVHVFDDNPQRRFVLINMDKYKEGQSIADNGPLVEEITREGVIVDYGDGRALLPPK